MNLLKVTCKRKHSLIPISFLLLFVALMITSCGGGSSSTSTPPSNPTVTSVTVSCSSLSIQTNQTSTCTPTVTGTGSPSQAVTWSVSPSSIGSVSSSGVFTPTGAGTATITATSTQDSTKSGTATIAVTAASTVTSVAVVCAPASIQTNQTSACTATVTGTGSPSQAVTWSVSPSSIGSMNSSGVFTPSGAGTATITAVSIQDTSKSGSATVAVVSVPSVTAVTASCTAVNLTVGQTDQCSAIVQGTGSYDSGVTWSANNIAGGNSTFGTISASGLYTAPSVVPSPNAIALKATSNGDSSKSSTSTVTITLKLAVSPSTATVQLFHTQQFSAVVTGVSNTSVTWAVNGAVGGNSSVGMIDTTGLYTPPVAVPASGVVNVSATSQADTSQTATAAVAVVADTTVPLVTATSPSANATGVPVQPSISITFNEALDPNSISSNSFTLSDGSNTYGFNSGYDSNSHQVTLSPIGLLTQGATYTVGISTNLRDLGGNSLAAPYSLSFQVEPPATLSGTVSAPNGVDPTTLTVASFQGQQSTLDSAGKFNASIATAGTTLLTISLSSSGSAMMAVGIASSSTSQSVSVANADGKSGLAQTENEIRLIRLPGKALVVVRPHQITASLAALDTSSSVVIDFQTTAEALLFYSPVLLNRDPTTATQIMTVIAADPNTTVLGKALQSAGNEAHPMQDPAVSGAYTAAIQSILNTLIEQNASANASAAAVNQTKSGLEAQPRIQDGLVGTEDASQQTSDYPVLTPIDVCCVNFDSFTFNGSNFNSNLQVKFGHAVGWFIRAVQMPPSTDPSTLKPVNGDNNNPDSPGPQAGEDGAPIGQPMWIPGNSVFQFGKDLAVELSNIPSSIASASGVSTDSTKGLSIPNTQPAYYLFRLYSGGENDTYELPLVSLPYTSDLSGGLYQGMELAQSAKIVNYVMVVVDALGATNGLKSGALQCEVEDLVNDGTIPNLVYTFQDQAISWDGYLQIAKVVNQDFVNNLSSCVQTSTLDHAFELLGDALGISEIADAIQSVNYAGEALQVVTELQFLSPVDTAYVTIGNPSVSSVATIALSPNPLNITKGSTATVSATAYDGAGNALVGVPFVWNVGDPSFAQISGAGKSVQVTGVNIGSDTVTATAPNGTTAHISVNILAGTPTISNLTTVPSPTPVGSFTMNITGTNFDPSTVQVYLVGGTSCPTSTSCVVSNGVITKTATTLAIPVTANLPGTFMVYVQNGAGGATSNGWSLTIGSGTPTITALTTNPSPTVVGTFTMNITGTNFNPSTVQVYLVGGTSCPTSTSCVVPNGVISPKTATSLGVPVTANIAGTYMVYVQNGAGGATSIGWQLIVGK